MSVSLSSLLQDMSATLTGDADCLISDIQLSSRDVRPGTLFVAIVGHQADGHRYVADAVARGAAAVVVSQPVEVSGAVTVVQVADTRAALSILTGRFFGQPSRQLALIGVTGTNGKTTSTYVLEQLLTAAGRRCGVIGTVNYRYGGKVLPAPNTTPDLVTFQRLLRDMVDAGVDTVLAEVSSHALHQRRVEGLDFRAALFTNLTRDHLDYHRDLEDYFDAKQQLFTTLLAESGQVETLAVTNLDDEHGARLLETARASMVLGYSRTGHPAAALRIEAASLTLNGIEAVAQTPWGPLQIRSRLLGQHNLENLLGAAAVCLGVGIPMSAVEAGIVACERVPGRLDEVFNDQGLKVLVDYAHTDDALRSVSRTLRKLTTGALITVFGCGGDRDKGKRPLMAAAALESANLAVITSDNPRHEAPQAIMDDIVAGVPAGALAFAGQLDSAHRWCVAVDRRQAIQQAIDIARPGDVVLIAGKGHETYQQVGDERLPFDDREEALAALKRRERTHGAL